MSVEPISIPASLDIGRRHGRRARLRGSLIVGAVVVTALVAAVGARALRPAVPTVDRAAVVVERVGRGPMLRAVTAQGTLVPEDIRWISASSPGRVESIVKRPGAGVEADTVVIELSNPDLVLAELEAQREASSAVADLANLEATLENQRLQQESTVQGTGSDLAEAERRAHADTALGERGFLSELETAKTREHAQMLAGKLRIEGRRLAVQTGAIAAQLTARRAQLERLRAIAEFRHTQIEALRVRAGIRGVMQDVSVQLGQSVVAGALLAKVADPTRLRAEVRVPETNAKDIRLGLVASIDTHGGIVPAKVSRIEPAVQGGTVRVELAPAGPWSNGARPDLSVEGTIELERVEDTTFVARPPAAEGSSTAELFKLVEDSTAVRVPVRFGRVSSRFVEVLDGLQAGDRVIVSDMASWNSVPRVELR